MGGGGGADPWCIYKKTKKCGFKREKESVIKSQSKKKKEWHRQEFTCLMPLCMHNK
jgi:hypothetical protein